MNENWLKYLVALSALLIAGSAAYFSVTGLGVLFSGAAIAVMVMASSLEFAKLVTATYLKQKWSEIGGLNKWYLTSAVAILMLITSAGIFGYLSNAFQQQNLKLQQVDREVLVHTTKIKQNETQIAQLSTQITESNTNQGKILDNGKVNSRLLRSVDNRDKQISKLNDRIAKLQEENAAENDSINKIKIDNIGIEKEVGGFRFVAEAFGVELNSVVKFFIILIVIVFDPLAVALIISFNQLAMNGKKKEEEDEDEVVESTPEDLKDFVDESSRLHLTEDDLKKLEEVLLNPPAPNEELKDATEKYKESLYDMTDQELTQYWVDQQEDNEDYIEEPIVNETPITREETQFVFKERKTQTDDISDWDSTLNDGLENEPSNFTDEEIQKLKEMDERLSVYEEEYVDESLVDYKPTLEEIEQNFSTMEPIPTNFFHNENDWSPELEEQYWEEEGKEHDPQFSDEFISEAIEEFNRESFEEEFGITVTVDKVDETSSENEDEKKNS